MFKKTYKSYPENLYLLYKHTMKQCFALLTSKHISKEMHILGIVTP